MKKAIVPVLALATVLFASSCGQDKRGSTTELVEANNDEEVNPRHIRGYGDREPGTTGSAAPKPSSYYSFSINDLPADKRLELQGNVAVEMVQTYYDPDKQLSDLYRKYKNQPAAAIQANTDTAASATDTTATSTTVPLQE